MLGLPRSNETPYLMASRVAQNPQRAESLPSATPGQPAPEGLLRGGVPCLQHGFRPNHSGARLESRLR